MQIHFAHELCQKCVLMKRNSFPANREGQVPAVVVMELSNGKIGQIRHYIDKLEAAKQMAKGLVNKRAVAGIVKQVDELLNP
jgi:hypothetical protein